MVALTLRAVDGAPLPAWTPGAHVDLILGDGRRRTGSTRSAATSTDRSAPTASASCATPTAAVASRHVHDVLAEGDVVRVRGPAQQLRAGARAALPVHRGRDRDHAASSR